MNVELSPTMENYLEMIIRLSKRGKVVRVNSLAKELKVRMPSVSEALNLLKDDGLVTHEKYGYIELTEKGSKIAEEIFSRHKVLFAFLTKILGIDPVTADEDACKMEHVVSPVTFSKLISFVREFSDRQKGVKNAYRGSN